MKLKRNIRQQNEIVQLENVSIDIVNDSEILEVSSEYSGGSPPIEQEKDNKI